MPNPPAEPENTPPSPGISRRELVIGVAGAVSAAALQRAGLASGQAPVPAERRAPGPLSSELGQRSPFEQIRRAPANAAVSRTPLHELRGTITPSDLHFERHHAGVPEIDPAEYRLIIHGLVERPLVFSLEDLKRFPSHSRICFLECSGNFARNAPEESTPQQLAGLTSQSEWTGVMLSTLLREVGVRPEARWFLAEGQDGAAMTRTIPLEKGLDDAMIAYAQNGEAIRPAQGYPARLLLPGYEGNTSVKWLRRIELSDQPFMTREETSKYTEPLLDGTARQFSFVMDARSIITHPTFPARVQPGWVEVQGIAWTGRGRIERVEVSTDDGATWHASQLQEPVLPMAHTRFRHLWHWDGREAVLLSRAVDETRYVQPTVAQLLAARGPGAVPYHLNPIVAWKVYPDGRVTHRAEVWG